MMEHKAFLFDYCTFERELLALLEEALTSNDTRALVSFINTHIENLRDPYEGRPLETDWQSLLEAQDAHQYGDVALTKYYDPLADAGLGASWARVQEVIAEGAALTDSPILGRTVGPGDNLFDPGKMGSYFQTPQQVKRNYTYMLNFSNKGHGAEMNRAVQMLEQAVEGDSGLYITF